MSRLKTEQKLLMFRLSVDYVMAARKVEITQMRKILRETRKACDQMRSEGVLFDTVAKLFHGIEWARRISEDDFLQEIHAYFKKPDEAACRYCGRLGSREVNCLNVCDSCETMREGYGE